MTKLLNRKAIITSDNENYAPYKDRLLKITHVAYNTEQHPGYDDSVSPQALCDFIVVKTGEDLPFSLYEYEFELV